MSYISEVLADSPVAFWPLNETSGTAAVDLTAVGTTLSAIRDGVYVGGPTLGGAGLVATNHAVATTSSSYVSLPTPGSLGNDISLEFWFEYVSGTTPLFRDNHTTGGWYFDISGTNPAVSIADSTHTISAVTSASLKDSDRHHVVITTIGSGIRLYLDGTLVDSWANGTLVPATTAYTFNLGKDGGNSSYAPAIFAAVAFYDQALSADRIAAHYAAADAFVAGVATVTVTALPVALGHPGTAGVTVTALPVALSAPVETRAGLRLVSSSITQVDAPPDAPDPRVVPIHIVSPSTPVPTLVNGVPQ